MTSNRQGRSITMIANVHVNSVEEVGGINDKAFVQIIGVCKRPLISFRVLPYSDILYFPEERLIYLLIFSKLCSLFLIAGALNNWMTYTAEMIVATLRLAAKNLHAKDF